MTTVTNTSPKAGARMNRQQRRQAARSAKKGRRGNGAAAPAEAALQEAVKLHKAGHPHEALQLYRKILAVRPKHPDALNFAGVAAFQTGTLNEALELLRAAVALAPDYAEAHVNLGNVLQAAGQARDAALAYRRALEIEPDNAQAHYNIGVLLQASGQPAQAITAYRIAVQIRPHYAEAWRNLGAVLEEFGDLTEAVAACRRTIALKPDDPAAHNNLGIALRACGEREAAVRALNRAIDIAPNYGKAHYNLAQLLYREANSEPAAESFTKASDGDPDLAMAHFYLGIIRDQQGDHEAARAQFAKLARHSKDTRHLMDSWDYAKSKQGPETRYHGDSFETLKFGLDQARVDGLVLEFGVRFGNSINFIAKNVERDVHGFDSFEGLPEAWECYQAGAYTTDGRLPQVAPNVRLHVGLFADTLPGFAAEQPGPIRFMNVDCDLYSSTRTVFQYLAERIVPGSVIVFDEYLINPRWRHDEFRAFQETVEQRSWRYEYLAFNMFTKQAVVRLI